MFSLFVEFQICLGGRANACDDGTGCWDVSILHELYDLSSDPLISEHESDQMFGGPAIVGQSIQHTKQPKTILTKNILDMIYYD